jgi:RES domain-containing protein
MPRRDSALIDTIRSVPPTPFSGQAWRIVREGRDPLQCGRPGGRWDDGSFDVLYTSLAKEGAIAEMRFHLQRGQPVFPSQVRYELHELFVSMAAALRFLSVASLAQLGISPATYGQLSYQGRVMEYPRTQDIAEVAHFLEFDGLLVPSARHDCLNAVIFCDRRELPGPAAVHNHGIVNWSLA